MTAHTEDIRRTRPDIYERIRQEALTLQADYRADPSSWLDVPPGAPLDWFIELASGGCYEDDYRPGCADGDDE